MIELPEATMIARQMAEALTGKRIAEAVQGSSPHKFAFVTVEPEAYARIMAGKLIGAAYPHGSWIVVPLEPGYVLVLGGGGERITYHAEGSKLPKKHQLLLRFTDDSYLSVTVQGWGSVELRTPEALKEHPYMSRHHVSPLDEGFTLEAFASGFASLATDDKVSLKYYLISEPGVLGIGNGCLQDILFRAGLHPRRRAATLTPDDVARLYDAMGSTLREMVALSGRTTECDLYGERGGYARQMDSQTCGQPCPTCGAAIEKISYLGGACYLCPVCQPLPA